MLQHALGEFVQPQRRPTGVDEEGTHRLLSESLDTVAGAVPARNGEVLHIAGDAVLADFGSVVDALTRPMDLQREFARRNEKLPEERRMYFRAGINPGDIVVDRDQI